ncbi:helix-turn-helix domain-containing protein [Actinomadura sp. KC345]|uniref:helix-turn-helix domain-containing protein n=1 Tax=Actinomadura sp. KC345 TaxID=2530371 RepID=UPI00104AF6D5|nr:helix-turn-helix domain-containing protein [Actinomadura sp. KC345]TDC51000.1 helix-turn-helix domain-containing protein [Actinomadura sp. KC345]
MIETVHTTLDFPAADRFDHWREWMSRTHSPVDLSSEHAAGFRAHTRVIRLGEVTVWPSSVQPLVSHRTAKLIRRSDPDTYNLTLIIEGMAGAVWSDSGTEYRAFDLHSQNSSRPCTVWIGRNEPVVKSVGVEIPKDLVALPRKSADRAVDRRLSGREGVGALLSDFVTRLCTDTDSYAPTDGPRLGTVLADLASALFAHTLDAERDLSPEAHQRTLALRVRAFIGRNLHDPDLTPRAIAAAHHISTSYLHRLFEDDDVTVGALIRGQRLEGARRDLCDPTQRTVPVHRIAARWGFSHHSTFTRAFRSAYGASPRDYREANQEPDQGHHARNL